MQRSIFLTLMLFGTAFPAPAQTVLVGTGSGRAAPLAQAWLTEWVRLHPGFRTSFQVRPPGLALEQWIARKAAFALLETPLDQKEVKRLLARPALQLPVAIAGAAVVYNAPGVPEGLRISAGILSRILAGDIVNWNDPRLTQMNPGWDLPPMPIRVFPPSHRCDPRDLLCALLRPLDNAWPRTDPWVWPQGRPVRDDTEAVKDLKEWAGSLAVLDADRAWKEGLPTAAVLNRAGRYVRPDPGTLAQTASDLVRLPDNFQVSLSSSSAPQAYPLSSFLWLMVPEDPARSLRDKAKAAALASFRDLALSAEGKSLSNLGFAPLPKDLRDQVLQKVRKEGN